MNNRGQFSIIAALFVASILISSVMITYATIRYSSNQEQPQILSAIDETNLALKQVLGFTVGYYGSVLQVTGNSSYARTLASNYLHSGLENIANIRPEWGASFTVTDLELSTNWFMNESYSKGVLNVTYALTGLGVSGVAYSASSRLDVNIFQSPSSSQILLNVTKDDAQPLNDLSLQNFKFYRYRYSNLTWEFVSPSSEPVAFSNGTYLIDVPSGINPYSYVIQVEDTRGLNVAASSYSRYTSTLTFNSTIATGEDHYVDKDDSNVDDAAGSGLHGDFSAQKNPIGPDGIYDSLNETSVGKQVNDYYPDSYGLLSGTTLVSGAPNNLQSDDGSYMTFESYASGLYSQNLYLHQETTSIGGTSYRNLLNTSADTLGLTLSESMSSQTRVLFGKSVYSLQGISYLPSSTWIMYYRAWQDAPTTPSVTNNPSSSSGSWANAGNAYNDNGNYAKSSNRDEQEVYRGYGFTIPSDAIVSQVRVRLDAWAPSGDDDIKLEVSADAGATWLTSTQISIATSETTYWIDVTGWTSWTPAKINNNNVQARVTHIKIGSTNEVRLDWIPIEVTYTTSAAGHADVDVKILKSDGSVRTTIATNVANSTILPSSATTLNGTYSFPSYNVVSQTDYLEIDYYVDVSVAYSANAYLRIDDNTLPVSDQTRVDIWLTHEQTCTFELYGPSNTNNWDNVTWTIIGFSSISGVGTTFQLYNNVTQQYPDSGDGYMVDSLGTAEGNWTQTITVNPTYYRDVLGRWSLRIIATNSNPSPFNISIDMAKYHTETAIYALDLEEQWTSLDIINPVLCIKTDPMGLGTLRVDAWNSGGSNWETLPLKLVGGWYNVSVPQQCLVSATFTIRFKADSGTSPGSWQIDAALLRPESDQSLFRSLQNEVAVVELLQNGTMRWLGQHLQNATEEIPIPPVPVKAIHVNQTTDGVDQEVPFQVEDWVSEYTVPVGLTNNATVFGNRQMIVFSLDTRVTSFTVWWNGSDEATQTPLAFTNTEFNDNPQTRTLNNGRLSLQFDESGFGANAILGSITSTAKFMRINTELDDTDPELSYVIYNGTIRDIVMGEPEYHDGAGSAANFYANVVWTLPAKATYYTYQLRLMFLDSPQSRTINDLSLMKLTSSNGKLQTENGTSSNIPIVADGTASFDRTVTWVHHWSQIISDDGAGGAGVMFTDDSNKMLYVFDPMAVGGVTGVLKADNASKTIELLPVALDSVSFQFPFDVTWHGAVATFDGTNPIYTEYGTKTGLWILAEIPPTISVTTDS